MLTRALGFLHIYSLFTKKKYTLLNKTRFSLAFLSFFVILASPNLLSFGKEIKNFGFCFVFRSLIRNFALD
jgi:hypothetical protein